MTFYGITDPPLMAETEIEKKFVEYSDTTRDTCYNGMPWCCKTRHGEVRTANRLMRMPGTTVTPMLWVLGCNRLFCAHQSSHSSKVVDLNFFGGVKKFLSKWGGHGAYTGSPNVYGGIVDVYERSP